MKKLHGDKDIENDAFKLQIHIDFNLEVLRFCHQGGFSAEQTATFVSIINANLRDSLKRKLSTDTSYDNLEEIVKKYLYQSPPYSLGIFSKTNQR